MLLPNKAMHYGSDLYIKLCFINKTIANSFVFGLMKLLGSMYAATLSVWTLVT